MALGTLTLLFYFSVLNLTLNLETCGLSTLTANYNYKFSTASEVMIVNVSTLHGMVVV